MSEQGWGDAAEAREALHQQEQQFRASAQSVQEYAVFLLDPSGVITTWNVGAERIKGWL